MFICVFVYEVCIFGKVHVCHSIDTEIQDNFVGPGGSNAGKGTLYFLGDLHFITKTIIEVGGEKRYTYMKHKQ